MWITQRPSWIYYLKEEPVVMLVMEINTSGLDPPTPTPTPTPTPASDPTVASLTMTLGILFNTVALIILAKAYARFRRRSKATFLLLASSLVATDLAGHGITGALVLWRHAEVKRSAAAAAEAAAAAAGGEEQHNASSINGCLVSPPSCQVLGGCMVFFGLCPLFLGCIMAAERCLGVTKPLVHARLVTTARTKVALALTWLVALSVALMPFFSLGEYQCQYPWTWCFIRVEAVSRVTDLALVFLFSGLALGSLASALVCNTVSGVTLVRARLRRRSSCSGQRRPAGSQDTEMVVQLLGIMGTSCVCWSPLLVFGLMSAVQSYWGLQDADSVSYYRSMMLVGVRMATWNQILDPWVYILLRRAVLRKIYRITKKQASFSRSTLRSVRWDLSSFHTSEKKHVTNI